MGFDWRSFATGFLERTQEIREKSEEEAKTFEEEQRAAAERNAQTISERNRIANMAVSYSNYLSEQGLSEAQIQAAIASGPETLAQLTEAVQEAVRANRGRPLAPSDVDAIMSMPEGFTPLDMTRQEFIDRSFGLSAPEIDRPEPRDPGILGSVFGFGQMDQARERLNRTPYMDGMTIEEINRVAQQQDYQSLIPGTFVTVTAMDRYDPTVHGADFVETAERQIAALQRSRRWTQTAGNQERQQELLEETMTSLISGYADRYGDAFVADQESYITSILGEDYTANFVESYLNPPEEDNTPAGPNDDVATEVVTEDIQTTTLPPLSTQTDAEGDAVQEPAAEPRTGLGGTSRGRRDRRPEVVDETQTNAAGSQSRNVVRATNELVNMGIPREDIDLVRTDGGNMQDFALERGATDVEQMKQAIIAYAIQEGINPPQNLDFVAGVLLDNLVQSGMIAEPQ